MENTFEETKAESIHNTQEEDSKEDREQNKEETKEETKEEFKEENKEDAPTQYVYDYSNLEEEVQYVSENIPTCEAFDDNSIRISIFHSWMKN